MTPEDKAPDMPDEMWIDYACVCHMGEGKNAPIKRFRYIRADTIQSPDQGAVEALEISLSKMRESIESVRQDITCISQRIEALTRPPLDLAGLRESHGPVKQDDREYGFTVGWNDCLDHLQAIRPDLFGGK